MLLGVILCSLRSARHDYRRPFVGAGTDHQPRFRALAARGKKSTVAVTAVARELATFMWAIVRAVSAT
jgi:hypothetical protein